jgi:outer membrane protein insertion porin family
MTNRQPATARPAAGKFAPFTRSLLAVLLFLAWLPASFSQFSSLKIAKIEIKHVGPQAVSDEMIRSNVRVKLGDPYLPLAVDDDVRNLYATGFFYNIRVTADTKPEGVVLTYIVQGKPRLMEIRFQGNKKYKDAKLRKKLTSKISEPLDERKVFTDGQELQKMYQKAGYPRTEINPVTSINEESGRATVTFEIKESPKIKIIRVEFVGAKAFTQKKLRKQIKTRAHWMFSWLTGSGTLKDEQFEDDKEKLGEFYREHGYIDFEIKEVQFLHPTARTMLVQFTIYEGAEYKVGAVKFVGNKLFSLGDITNGLRRIEDSKKVKNGPNGLPMDVGNVFKPSGMGKDIEAVEDFYGGHGYIDVSTSTRNLTVVRIPNTDTGTMDLEFRIDEGQKSYIEKVEIRGNTKTKDKVIRRELAVSPGEPFDMVRVKLSKQRLEGLQYFSKVDARPEPTDIPSHKNLVIGVDEANTGHLMVGAGFSSIDALVGYAEVSQGNFDLFHPPTFTGGGQKLRLRVQLGTQRQDYLISFIEPWFTGRKLSLGVDLYYHEWNFQSLDNIYDEVRAGASFSLERALGSDFLRGRVSYTVEDVGILLNSPFHDWMYSNGRGPAPAPSSQGSIGSSGVSGAPGQVIPPNLPNAILAETGYHFLSRVGTSLAYDTRNSVRLSDKGQRTELGAQFVGGPLGGDKEFYKLDFTTAWYFPGFKKGHVLELGGRAGVAKSLQSGDVPFYERYYLGGIYSLRGFKYRSVSPREFGFNEPIGGDSFWFGFAEYSIPLFEQEHGIGVRLAAFYDIGNVASSSYSFNFNNFDDNWGIGLRLNLPIGPLRLDYGIPIHHDIYNGSSGQFQFSASFDRPF